MDDGMINESDNKDNKYRLANTLDDHKFTESLDRVKTNEKEVKRIDYEISRLMYERMLYIKDSCDIVNKSVMQTSRAWYISPSNKSDFIAKFDAEGFNNDDVKSFVYHIRELYFDDTDDRFKEYDCIYIRECSVWNEKTTIEIGFSNGKTTIALEIPSTVKPYYDSGYIGGTTVVRFTNDSVERMKSFPGSYSFLETAHQIRNIVENNGNPTIKTTEQIRQESGSYVSCNKITEQVGNLLSNFEET